MSNREIITFWFYKNNKLELRRTIERTVFVDLKLDGTARRYVTYKGGRKTVSKTNSVRIDTSGTPRVSLSRFDPSIDDRDYLQGKTFA